MIEFDCICGKRLAVPPELAGKQFHCQHCLATVIAPGGPGALLSKNDARKRRRRVFKIIAQIAVPMLVVGLVAFWIYSALPEGYKVNDEGRRSLVVLQSLKAWLEVKTSRRDCQVELARSKALVDAYCSSANGKRCPVFSRHLGMAMFHLTQTTAYGSPDLRSATTELEKAAAILR